MDYEILDVPFEMKEADLKIDGSFRGLGSPFGGKPDSKRDVVQIGAFAKTIAEGGRNGTGTWPFLWYHNVDQPQGIINELTETKTGLAVGGKYALETTRGNDSYILARMGAADQLSIGYDVEEAKLDEKKEVRTLTVINPLWEISQVTFGAASNRARITGVKSALEECKTERELERALREVGLSIDAAKGIAGLLKPYLREAEEAGRAAGITKKNVEEVLRDLRGIRAGMQAYGQLKL